MASRKTMAFVVRRSLGKLVQNVGRLVNPASLTPRLREDLLNRLPEPEGTVTDCNLRAFLKASGLEVQEYFPLYLPG
jgi:hypothetical protein